MKKILFLLLPIFLFSNPSIPKIKAEPIRTGFSQEKVALTGTIYFSERSKLASEVSGVIEEVFVHEGQKVKKGQKLARLNGDILEKEILSQNASLRQAKAQLQKVKNHFERYKKLYKSQSVAYKEYEDALYNLQSQEANTQSIEAKLQNLRAKKSKKILKAPYDGVILENHLKQGEWANIGQSIFSIANINSFEAKMHVPFSVMRNLKIGQDLEVKIAGENYDAKIKAIIPLGNTQDKTFPIKLSIKDPNNELIEGLEITHEFSIRQKNNQLAVPRNSVISANSGYEIFILEGKIAKKIPIYVDNYEENYAYISPLSHSLSTKTLVITQGFESLKDGQEVKRIK